MGKYGNGVSMRSAIEMEMQEANEILNRTNISEEDRKALLDIIQEMAYQWCQSNAFACAMEKALKEEYPEVNLGRIVQYLLRTGVKEEFFGKTYPFE